MSSPAPSSDPRGPCPERFGLAAAGFLVVLTLAALFVVQNVDAPFGLYGVPSEVAVYCELMSQPWDEMGFVETLGMPMLLPAGDTVAERHPYIHHPAAGFWPNYWGRTLLGKSSEGYRLFPLLANALTALLLWCFVRRFAGTFWAVLCALLFLGSPLMQLFGSMPNSEPYTLLTGMVLALFYLRWKRAPTRGRLVALLVLFLLGCQVDWQVYFLAPGIWVAELLDEPSRRRLKPTLLLFPVGVAGFCLVLLHMQLAVGDLEIVFDQIVSAAAATQELHAQDTAAAESGELVAHARMFEQDFGVAWGVLLLVFAVVVARSARWRHDPLTGLGAMFLTGGTVAVILFHSHAATHGTFWYLAGVGFPILMIQLARATIARWQDRAASPGGRVALHAAAALVLLAISAEALASQWSVKQALEREGYEQQGAQFDAMLDVVLDEELCLCSPEQELRPLMLYSRRRWAPPSRWPSAISGVLRYRDEGKTPWKRFVVMVKESSRAQWPEFLSWLEEESKRRGSAPHVYGDLRVFIL